MKHLFLTKFFTVAIIFTATAVHAGWLEDAWNEMTTSNSTSSAAIQNQGSYGYSGGSYTLSSKRQVVNPISVRPPSVSAGCSGISLDMGAFQYNMEDIISFVKAIGTAAPGYAMQLALQILCPSCTDLMNTLNELSSMINGMQLDSCATLQAAGNFLQDKIASNNSKDNLIIGKDSYFNSTLKKISDKLLTSKDTIEKSLKCFGNTSVYCTSLSSFMSEEMTLLVAVQAVLKSEYSGANADFVSDENINILRAIIGDAKVEKDEGKDANGNSKNIIVRPIPPSNNQKLYEIVNIFTYGNTNKQPGITGSSVETYEFTGKDKDEKDVTFFRKPNKTFANSQLNKILIAFQARSKLENETLQFLSSFRSPVYKVIDSYSVDMNALQVFIDNFKPLAGSQLTYEYFALATKEIIRVLGEYEKNLVGSNLFSEDTSGAFNYMKRQLRDLQKAAYDEYLIAYADFDKKVMDNDNQTKLINMNRAVMARHPVMGSSVFARGGAR